MELDLNQLIKLIAKKFLLLILIVFVFSAGAFAISKFVITPKYQTKSTILVEPREINDNNANFAIAQSYVDLCVLRLTSGEFLTKVSDALWALDKPIGQSITEKFTDKQLREFVSASKGNNLSFVVSVNTTDMELSYKISQTIESIIETELLSNKTNKINISVILKAEPIVKPTSPNIALNTIIGFIIGLMVGVLLIIIIDQIDNTVKNGEDLLENYEYSLLGTIYEHKFNELGENR